MLNRSTRDNIDTRTGKLANRHLTWSIIQWRNVFTPFATEYRGWLIDGGKVEFIEFYIFGIRVARWRL